MKKIYYGEIKEFESILNVNLIEIAHFRREQFEPHKKYYIEPRIEYSCLALNHYIYTFKPSKMVVNYIKRESNHEQIGLKRFREFNFVELEQKTTIKYEIYEVLSPFNLEEYFDGKFLYLIFTNLNIEISVYIDGITHRLSNTVFRCHFNTENVEVIIKGTNFLINHRPLSRLEKEMNYINISICSNYLIISINLDKTRCTRIDKSKCINNTQIQTNQDNSLMSHNNFDFENKLKNISISENQSTKTDLINFKYYNIKNNKVKFNEDMIGADNYLLIQNMLIIRLDRNNLDNSKLNLDKTKLNLDIGQLQIKLEKGNFLLNKRKIELSKALDIFIIIEKYTNNTL